MPMWAGLGTADVATLNTSGPFVFAIPSGFAGWDSSGGGTALPQPTSVSFNPPAPTVKDNSTGGTTIGVISVATSDGSQFAGSLSASPSSLVGVSGSALVLSPPLRQLTMERTPAA